MPRPTQQATQDQYVDNPGAMSAAYSGAAEHGARLQCERERNAYYANGGTGRYRCSNGYRGGNNYAGNYNNRNSNIQWR